MYEKYIVLHIMYMWVVTSPHYEESYVMKIRANVYQPLFNESSLFLSCLTSACLSVVVIFLVCTAWKFISAFFCLFCLILHWLFIEVGKGDNKKGDIIVIFIIIEGAYRKEVFILSKVTGVLFIRILSFYGLGRELLRWIFVWA